MASIKWVGITGKSIEIEARGEGQYNVVFGTRILGRGKIETSNIPAVYAADGAVAVIRTTGGIVGLTAERRDALLALDTERTATDRAARAADPLLSPAAMHLGMLERTLTDAREAVTMRNDRRHAGNPATLYATEQRAESALTAWIAAHQVEYDAISAARAAKAEAERAQRRAIYGGERIARGED